MTTFRLPDTLNYTTVEFTSCLVTPSAHAYGSEGWEFESRRARRVQMRRRSEALSVGVEAPPSIIDDSFDHLTALTGGGDTCEQKFVIGCSTGHFVLPNISVNPGSN